MPTISTLVVDVTANTSKFTSGMNSAGTAQSKLGSKVKDFAKIVGVAFGATAVVQFGKASIQAFEGLEKNVQRLDVGLGKIGQGAASKGILDWSKRFSLQTGVNQSDIVDMTSKLEGMGSAFFKAAGPNAAAALEKLTGGLQDMSAATGKSASMLMRSLGPSILNTPDKATSMLVKLGVVTDAQAAKITKLAKAGDKQAATQMEINAIQAKFAGTAAATATPMAKLSNLWNQLEISAGRALVPIISGLLQMVGWMGKNASLLKTVAAAVAVGAVAWMAYSAYLKIAAAWQEIMNTEMTFNPIGLIIAAVVLLAIVIIRNWSKIKEFTIAAWGAIRRFLLTAWNAIKHVGTTIWHALYRVLSFTPLLTIWKVEWKVIAAYFKIVWGVLKTVFRVGIAAVRDVILPVLRFIAGHWRTIWNGMKDVFSTVWNSLVGIAKPIINALIFVLNGLIHGINAVLHGYNLLPGHADAPTIPTIPSLQYGGVVARTGFALVHEGERFSGVGGGGMGNVTVNVYGSVIAEHDLGTTVQKALLKTKRRSGALGLA